MATAKRPETEIAAVVVAYLEACGHDVYQEVEARGGICDIVALVGPGREVWVVETKDRLSFDLIEQCLDRRRSAQRVFAAVPVSRHRRSGILEALGLGLIIVGDDRADARLASMAPKVSSDPRHGRYLRERCAPGHKTHALAGSSSGGRYTPFVATVEALCEFVERNPGCGIKEAVDGIRHHYASPASARSTIPKWIRSGHITGVRIETEGRAIRLFPDPGSRAKVRWR